MLGFFCNMKLINKKKIQNREDLIKFIKKNWVLLLAIIYFFVPLDIIPDILPAFGFGDDIFVLLATLFIKYRRSKKGKSDKDIVEGEIINE